MASSSENEQQQLQHRRPYHACPYFVGSAASRAGQSAGQWTGNIQGKILGTFFKTVGLDGDKWKQYVMIAGVLIVIMVFIGIVVKVKMAVK